MGTETYDDMGAEELRKVVREKGICNGKRMNNATKPECLRLLAGDSPAVVFAGTPRADLLAPTVAPAAPAGDLASIIAASVAGLIKPGMDEDRVRALIADEIGGMDISGKVKDVVDAILNGLAASVGMSVQSLSLIATGKATGATVTEQALTRWCLAGRSCRPVLFAGPAGSGKTTAARLWNKRAGFDTYAEYQCSPDHDRADLLGKDIPVPTAGGFGFAWSDSSITRAFRSAAAGKNTLLVIDEIFRLQKRTRESLLSALAPTLDGHYVLETGRTLAVVDGVADTETIKAPCNKLAIVATTNAGSAYGLDESCPAEAERWAYVYVPTDWAFAADILTATAKAAGWTNPGAVAAALVGLGKSSEALKASCELWHNASLRTLARALRESKPNDKAGLMDAIRHEAQAWAAKDQDGKPIESQVAGVVRLVAGFVLS